MGDTTLKHDQPQPQMTQKTPCTIRFEARELPVVSASDGKPIYHEDRFGYRAANLGWIERPYGLKMPVWCQHTPKLEGIDISYAMTDVGDGARHSLAETFPEVQIAWGHVVCDRCFKTFDYVKQHRTPVPVRCNRCDP